MVSILGKRARAIDSSVDALDSPPPSQRVKRRAGLQRTDDATNSPQSRQALHKVILSDELEDDKENLPQLPTPKTPRHRDALSKKIQITPRHHRQSGKPLAPHAPRTPRTPSNANSPFALARRLFLTGTEPGMIIGREAEKAELSSAMKHNIEAGQSQCVYVSGPPGTGKSVVVGELCDRFRTEKKATSIYVNCMSIRTSEELSRKLLDELIGDPFRMSGAAELASELEKKLSKSGKSTPHRQSTPAFIITLDEVDSLLQVDIEIVYKLFEWAMSKSSNFILIGIANALDLTDRFLPRLRARNLKPQLLPFLPYTAVQIQMIISEKLRSLLPESTDCPANFTPFVQPVAIQLCAKKVASQTGDLRKAFNIMRRTIDVLEAEATLKQRSDSAGHSPSKQPLGENPNQASPVSQQSQFRQGIAAEFTPVTAPRATIAHVSQVAAAVLNHGTTQRINGLNLQQKATLCALVQHEMRQRTATPSLFATPTKSKNVKATVRTLYSAYSAACQRENTLTPLKLTEFVDVVSSLESLGLICRDGEKVAGMRSTPKKRAREEDRTMSSLVDPREVKESFQGTGGSILRALIEDM